jgi:hypothetical protein
MPRQFNICPPLIGSHSLHWIFEDIKHPCDAIVTTFRVRIHESRPMPREMPLVEISSCGLKEE